MISQDLQEKKPVGRRLTLMNADFRILLCIISIIAKVSRLYLPRND